MSMTKRRVVTAIVFIIFGVMIGIVMNQTVWSNPGDPTGSAVTVVDISADRNCSFSVQGRWSSDNAWGCYWDDLTSPDARQMVGNAATACGVAWWAGGPVGCGWAAVGGIVSAIPWDGTWD